MSSLSPKDRVSLCSFAFSDGRRCRTPRSSNHPHFCFYHAQKEARAFATDKLGKDLAFFFSGDYLSACDLSTALGRLIPAVIRGDVKPRAARTVAYLAQTLMQVIHVSQHEYCEAFGSDAWRQAICNSVKGNYNYRFPPAPKPAPPAPLLPQPHPQRVQTPVNCHSDAVAQAFRPEESASSSNSPLATHHSPLPPAPQPTPLPHTPLPPMSAEFAQQIVAGLQTSGRQVPQLAQATQPAPASPPANQSAAAKPQPPPQPQTPVVPNQPVPPVKPPQPVAQPFRSLALPPHVRRRLHRDPA